MPRARKRPAGGDAERMPSAPEVEAPGGSGKRARRETHSWVDAVWGAAPGGLARVASRDDAARDACTRGVLEVSRSGGKASATRLFHAYPLRLIVPRKVGVERPGADCVWCYQVNFGGGLVAGDRAGASVDVADGCACVLATQGANKVYKHAVRVVASETRRDEPTRARVSLSSSPDGPGATLRAKTSRETTQALAGRVGAGALLASLPDPTQAFRDARFRQTQRFVLDKTASLVSVDWLVSGRAAFRGGGAGGFVSGRGGGVAPGTDATLTEGLERGERWRFASYRTHTEVFVDARDAKDDAKDDDDDDDDDDGGFVEVCADACSLKGDRSGALARRMGDTHALATVILLGPRCAAAAATVAGGARDVFARADDASPRENEAAKPWLLVSSSPVPAPLGCDDTAGGIILRVAGPSTDAVYETLRVALAPLADELGAPPYAERGMS